MPSLLEQTAEMLHELFDYNRENYRYDRKQRQVFEYQLSNLRIDQAKLWREDVRDIAELTPQKMEVYLLVIALELGFCVMALCKGRVPAGAPPWLIACHTLSVCSAIMYLFLALWYGMHAFVSSQAYKVRILTQLVRLPVPTWKTIEAARTYGSSFEQQSTKQIVRVPFLFGSQESMIGGPRGGGSPNSGLPSHLSTFSDVDDGSTAPAASDPWGLERRGDDIRELQPDVNTNTEKQKHIWLVREAGRFFQTYDAFCRICMSAGTSSLATFFCYFCLSYVLTENAAPVAAWAGMCVFSGCALVIMRQDLLLQGREFLLLAFLNFIGPALSGLVTFVSSKTGGDAGRWEYLMPIALLSHGVWLFYFIFLFRVREVHTGQYLPMAFRAILFLDAFAWAKHAGTWSKGFGRSLHRMADATNDRSTTFRTSMNRRSGRPSTAQNAVPVDANALPTSSCASGGAPRRPEDIGVAAAEAPQADNVSFRPGTFAAPGIDSTSPDGAEGQRTDVHTGTDIQGEKPGLVPWRIFLFNTMVLGTLWVFAAGVALTNAIKGTAVFVKVDWSQSGSSAAISNPASFGGVSLLQGSRVNTSWGEGLSAAAPSRPRGLACDPDGAFFVTSGLSLPGGGAGLMYGTLALHADHESNTTSDKAVQGRKRREAVQFASVEHCAHMLRGHGAVQDISLHDCKSKGGCKALAMPRYGENLVSCPLRLEDDGAGARASMMSMGREWLDDRGGQMLDEPDADGLEGLLHPEELSSLSIFPCGTDECAVVGTTAQRVVQMSKAPTGSLVPWRSLRESHGEALGAGSITSLDSSGRRLAVLQRGEGLLRVVDMSKGGLDAGVWRLQPDPADVIHGGLPKGWSAVCAGGGSLFALEEEKDGKAPSLWRFRMPKEVPATAAVGPAKRVSA